MRPSLDAISLSALCNGANAIGISVSRGADLAQQIHHPLLLLLLSPLPSFWPSHSFIFARSSFAFCYHSCCNSVSPSSKQSLAMLFKSTFAAFALLRLVSATPIAQASTLSPSPDDSCGGTTGYTVPDYSATSCCSAYGFCGDDADHCGTGCQVGFGACGTAVTLHNNFECYCLRQWCMW